MEIKSSDYNVWLDSASNTVHMEGAFRLGGTDTYDQISAALDTWLQGASESMTLDLRRLEYLNSSGINMLAKFTIGVRNKGGLGLSIKGNKDIAWQSKSLLNLKRLFTTLDLSIE